MSLVDIHIGTRIKDRRRSLGITQSDLAQTVGFLQSVIRDVEAGTTRLSVSDLDRLAEALNVPTSFFFEDLQDKPVAGDAKTGLNGFLTMHITEKGDQSNGRYTR